MTGRAPGPNRPNRAKPPDRTASSAASGRSSRHGACASFSGRCCSAGASPSPDERLWIQWISVGDCGLLVGVLPSDAGPPVGVVGAVGVSPSDEGPPVGAVGAVGVLQSDAGPPVGAVGVLQSDAGPPPRPRVRGDTSAAETKPTSARSVSDTACDAAASASLCASCGRHWRAGLSVGGERTGARSDAGLRTAGTSGWLCRGTSGPICTRRRGHGPGSDSAPGCRSCGSGGGVPAVPGGAPCPCWARACWVCVSWCV